MAIPELLVERLKELGVKPKKCKPHILPKVTDDGLNTCGNIYGKLNDEEHYKKVLKEILEAKPRLNKKEIEVFEIMRTPEMIGGGGKKPAILLKLRTRKWKTSAIELIYKAVEKWYSK